MVYCKLISNTKESVCYAFGGNTGDLTGIVEYNYRTGECKIIKKPENSAVLSRNLVSVLNANKSKFAEGNFPQIIAREI